MEHVGDVSMVLECPCGDRWPVVCRAASPDFDAQFYTAIWQTLHGHHQRSMDPKRSAVESFADECMAGFQELEAIMGGRRARSRWLWGIAALIIGSVWAVSVISLGVGRGSLATACGLLVAVLVTWVVWMVTEDHDG